MELCQLRKFEVYFCPVCGRIVKHEYPSETVPNTMCGPHFNEEGKQFIGIMIQIWPKEKEKR